MECFDYFFGVYSFALVLNEKVGRLGWPDGGGCVYL
jgi:hypothetical protein